MDCPFDDFFATGNGRVANTPDFIGKKKVNQTARRSANRSPQEAINSQHLREDVYYRLNVFQIQLPALREHKQDIPAIAQALIADLNEKHKCRVTDLDPAVAA